MILRRKSKKIYLGDAVAFYLTWYGIVRFIIESLRTDPLMIGNIRVALLTSIIFFVVGVAVFILRRVFKYRLEPVKDFFKNGTMWKDETYDPFIEIEERKRLEKEKREARKNKKDMNKDEQS